MRAAASGAAAGPTLINIVGTLAWGVFEAVEKAIVGPPRVPPGSTVTVSSAPLSIDCGPGVTVTADWYFPTSDPAPTRLILFAHGWPGTAPMYDYTAAELAERTDSIVVAPTITGNPFDCYSCTLTGEPMHLAIAQLFQGDRTALTDSARAASGDPNLVLPDRFVLAGHSGGSLLAVETAGFFEKTAPTDERSNLVGVLLFDIGADGGILARSLANIPGDVPVYDIAAEPNMLDSYGGSYAVFAAARPGQFVGVQMVGGTHADSQNSSNKLVQYGGQLAGGGLASRQNMQAVQDLAVGWINDWFAGTHDGVYGTAGSTIDIPTDAGTAQALILPVAAPQLNFIQSLSLRLIDALQILNQLQVCATPVDITATDSAAADSGCLTGGTL
jgi:pimeloyl-ACP methyl ester carboxylesterase